MSAIVTTRFKKKLLAVVCCGTGLVTLAASHAAFAAPVSESVPPFPPDATATLEPQVLVQAVEFSGNRTFTPESLSAQIAADIGKPLTFVQIEALARKIEAFYRDAGYQLVKVIVPEQEFGNDRALKLMVLEGWLGQVAINNNQRFSSEQVQEILRANGVKEAKAFKLSDVERALITLNRRSGIEVSSTLKPGSETGSTDLVVDVQEEARIKGSIELNNYGSENSGEYRLIPSLTLPNLSGRGDEMNVIAMTNVGSGDVRYGYVDYKTPIGTGTTSAQFYASKGNVGVGREFKVLEIEGDSLGLGVGLAHEYLLSARTSLGVSAWLEVQDMEQTMLGTVTSEDEIRKLRLGVSFDHSDLDGRTLASFDVHQGLGEVLGGMDSNSLMSSRSFARADNNFTKVTYDLIRLQRLTPRLMVVPRFYGQYAFNSVVSSEEWAIGGVNSVMGHSTSAASGDSGFTASVEGRYAMFENDDRYQLIGRLDHGQVFIKKPLLDQDDKADLSGAGIGFLARPYAGIDLRLDVGLPIGGKTDDSTYVYGQVRYRF